MTMDALPPKTRDLKRDAPWAEIMLQSSLALHATNPTFAKIRMEIKPF